MPLHPSGSSFTMRATLGMVVGLSLALAPSARATGIVAQSFTVPGLASNESLGDAALGIADKVALGAPFLGTSSCGARGAVYVFDATGGSPLYSLFGDPIEGCFGRFGAVLAEVQGDLLVSAPFRRSGGQVSSSGEVYRFDLPTGALERTFSHPAPTSIGPDQFGAALAVSGDDLFIGAPEGVELSVGADVLPSGIAFRFDAATGDLVGSYTSPAPQGNDAFGAALAISGGRLLVGAPGVVSGVGAVHAFDLATGQHLWTAVDPGLAAGSFGMSLAATETVVAVGDPFGVDPAGTGRNGRVYLLDAATGGVLHTLGSPDRNPASPGAAFGSTLTRFGEGFLVGAPALTVGTTTDHGVAYLLEAATGTLEQRFNTANPGDFLLRLGTAVGAVGDRVLVGTPGSNDGDGGALLFETCRSLGDGTTCDDGDGCTTDDVCQGARCVPGPAVTCLAPLQCRVPGCEPASGRCHERRLPNGSLCFLGGPTDCSVGDLCFNGGCFRNFDVPPPNQRDTDFDGVCQADDLCPGVANPGQEDADADGVGDACDARDGLLLLHDAVLRTNRADRAGTGRIALRGELLSRSDLPDSIPFNPDAGVSIRLRDSASFSVAHAWPAEQCTGSGRLRCTRPGRPTARIAFRPLQQRSDGLIVYDFSVKLDAIDIANPLVAPLRATLTSQPATPVLGFDRVGAIDGCREGRRRFACRVAVPIGSASEAFLETPASLVD